MYVKRNSLWSLVHEQFSFRQALVVKYWWQYLIFITTHLMNVLLNNSDMLKTQSVRMANISCLHKAHEDCTLRLLTSQTDGGMRRNHMIVSGVLSFTFFFGCHLVGSFCSFSYFWHRWRGHWACGQVCTPGSTSCPSVLVEAGRHMTLTCLQLSWPDCNNILFIV